MTMMSVAHAPSKKLMLWSAPISIQRRLFSTLHASRVGSSESSSGTIFLHGLLGNGKNLSTLAKKVGGGTLMDLRGHGNSRRGLTGEHTFENCAKDVLETMEGKASIIMGHSFGGRVALECAVQQESQSTWILDSVPGQTHESVERVLRVLQEMGELKHQYDNRSQIRESLQEQHGLEASIAQWLTSGVSKDEDGDLMWGFDMDVINALMPQFATQDYFGMLEFLVLSEETPAHNVHLVRGGKNEGWSVEILSQLDKIARRSDRFHLHVSPHAGHWIHVDDLPLLVKLFEMYHSAV